MTQRERIVRHILSQKKPFTTRALFPALPNIPHGSVSSAVSTLAAHRALGMMPVNGTNARTYQVVSPALAKLDWPTLRTKVINGRRPGRPRKTEAPPATFEQFDQFSKKLYDVIREWQRKAAAYDRLLAALKTDGGKQ